MFTSHWDVTVGRDRLSLFERKTGKRAERAARCRFSSPSLLVSQPEMLEQEFCEPVIEMIGKRRLFLYPRLHVTTPGTPLEPAEREALRRVFLDAGCSKVSFPDEE